MKNLALNRLNEHKTQVLIIDSVKVAYVDLREDGRVKRIDTPAYDLIGNIGS